MQTLRVCDWKVTTKVCLLDIYFLRYVPNVSTSAMYFVSSCKSMSLGTVSGLLSMWPLYFLGQRGEKQNNN